MICERERGGGGGGERERQTDRQTETERVLRVHAARQSSVLRCLIYRLPSLVKTHINQPKHYLTRTEGHLAFGRSCFFVGMLVC